MTKEEAKAETLAVWNYLKDNPDIDSIHYLPFELFKLIESYVHMCPLCELFKKNPLLYTTTNHLFCPLKSCYAEDSPYFRWKQACKYSADIEARRAAAEEICQTVLEWEI